MSKQQITQIKRDLEDLGFSLAAIGREVGVTRQTVSKALRNPTESVRVRAAICTKLGRNPWPEENAA